MALSDHVNLVITQDSVGVSRAGFGVPLILSHTAAWVERTRTYNKLSDVAADFPTTSVEYLTARAILSQSPKPSKIKIGRANDAVPTQTYTITPAAVNDAVYRIQVEGEGVTPTTVEFTADATATVAEITAGLFAALNAVVGKNFTATDNATDVTVDGDAAGDWFSLEVLDVELLDIVQDHVAPAGLDTALNDIQVKDPDWYCLLTNFNSEAYGAVVWAFIETQKKIYIFDSSETESITTVAGNGDALDTLATENRGRTAGVYHPSPADFNAASWAGKVLPLDPGSATWKFKQLSGPAALSLTGTQRANLVARNANFFETVASKDIMSEGTMGDGEFIDTVRGLDKLDDDITKSVFEVLLPDPKTPYTDDGVNQVKGAVLGALKRGINDGILAPEPVPVVTAPLVADIPAVDRGNRVLPDVAFTGRLAGAIHSVDIDGVVSV